MSEFIRYVGWIFVAIVGVCVLFYYIARCIIDRDDWDKEKIDVKEEDNGDNQYY